MERTWEELVSSYNATLSWIAETLSDLLRWKKPKLTMESVTTADDLDLRNILLDLYMNGRISGRTALDTLRLDPVEENKKMIEEQTEMQRDADKEKAKFDKGTTNLTQVSSTFQSQQGGGGAESASPGSQSMSNTPQRPEDIIARAEQVAQQMLQMEQSQRRIELDKIRQSDPLLHGAVMQEINKQRSHRGSDAGQAQAQQQ